MLKIEHWTFICYLLTIVLADWTATVSNAHEHLCLEDDYTNDLPIFIEKRTICNFELAPVHVYSVKITPDTDYETKLCLKGCRLNKLFNITFLFYMIKLTNRL